MVAREKEIQVRTLIPRHYHVARYKKLSVLNIVSTFYSIYAPSKYIEFNKGKIYY